MTKLWNNSHHPDDVEAALDASLKDLGTDYVDLYLMHWPSPFKRGPKLMEKGEDGKVKTGDTDYVDTYKAMEKCFKSGKARAIGISNFSKAEVQRLLDNTSVVCNVSDIMTLTKTDRDSRFLPRISTNATHISNSKRSSTGTSPRAST